MTALIGSTTRKYTTASTRTLTLSLVMPSWAGTAMATICMLTFCSRSPIGRMIVSPGPRVPGRTLPNLKIRPCSYCCTTFSERAATIPPPMIRTMRMTRRIPRTSIGNTSSPTKTSRTPGPQPSDNSSVHNPLRGRRAGRPGRAGGPETRSTWPIRCTGAYSLLMMRSRDTDWEGVRLHVVTGKGGTGKTTVAAALALALAAGGKRVLLMEVEGRQGIAQLFDVPPLPYEERKVAVGPATLTSPGGDVYALMADPEHALVEYLEMFYNLRHAGTALTKLGVMDFATTIAPGLRDVLLTGKAAEAVRRKDGRRRHYDAVVMDAPPTGRIGRFLNVTSEVSDLARVGPIRGHADTVQKVIRSPETVVHFVTVLEEMPVQETLDGIAELRSLGGIRPGGIIVNMARPLALPPGQVQAAADGELDQAQLALGLKLAGLDDSSGLAGPLAAELAAQAKTALGQELQQERLDAAGQPCYQLPWLNGDIGLAGLYRLASALRQQKAA